MEHLAAEPAIPFALSGLTLIQLSPVQSDVKLDRLVHLIHLSIYKVHLVSNFFKKLYTTSYLNASMQRFKESKILHFVIFLML